MSSIRKVVKVSDITMVTGIYAQDHTLACMCSILPIFALHFLNYWPQRWYTRWMYVYVMENVFNTELCSFALFSVSYKEFLVRELHFSSNLTVPNKWYVLMFTKRP